MTFKTPFHLQRRSLISDGHLVHASMTGGTADALVHVNAVIKICVVRQVVNSDPLNRFAGAKTGAHRFEIRALSPNLLMTIHAGVGRRHSGGGSGFDGGVAVAAIQTVVADVVLVTKLHRLLAFDPLPRVPGRAIQFRRDPQRRHENENSAIDRELRECVCTVMKNLGHRRSFANSSLQIQVEPGNPERVATDLRAASLNHT